MFPPRFRLHPPPLRERSFKIRNVTRNATLCQQASVADRFRKRAMGLMFRKGWDGFDGLLLSPCRSIHTFCMRMEIDVCFLDSEKRVLKALGSLGPWRAAHGGKDSHSTLELPAGTLERTGTRVGDRLAVDRPADRRTVAVPVEG